MAFNIFDNIFDQFTKQAQPQVPNFGTPQAPRTSSYVAPNLPYGQSQTTAGGATTQQKPINTSLPMGIPEPYLPKDTGIDTTPREQRPVYNFLQNVSDVVTSLPGRFQETVQQDQTKFEQDIKKKQLDFANAMLAKGYAKPDIFRKLNELKAKGEFDFKPGISESIVGGMGTRLQSNIDTTERLSKIQNPLERTLAGVIPYAGQTVASVTQPIASALEPYVSPVVKAIVEKTGQTQNIQDLSNQWSQFEKNNPILAENIAGALNVSQLAPVPFAKPIGNAIEQGVKTGAKAIVRGAEVVAPKVVQGIKTGVKATEEGVGKVTKSIVSQQSGLGTPSIESILKNPELQGKIRSGELSAARTLEEARTSIDALREGFRETGKMYDTIRKSDVKVSTNEAKQVLLSQLESDGLATGLKLNLVDLPVKDRGAITQALKYIDEYKGEMTPQSALSIRQKLDDLINYKSDVGSNGQRIVIGLRAKYDEFLGQKLPGLKEIDAKYAPERQFWESIRKDIYKADGTLKDNALSVISNITNKGNEAKLARMESILPGIGEKVKALRAFEDIQASSGIKVGTYARNLSTVGLATVNPILALGAWVATHPVVVARVLESIGIASQKIKSILAKGKNITKEDATIIQKAVAKTPKSKVEGIINNLSYDPKTSKLTSKTLVKKPTVKPNSTTNAKQPRNIVKPSTKSDSDIPEGYFKNAFGEIQKNPSNKKGGFIRNPFAKPEPKRLFAGENSAQPPKGKTGWFKGADGKMRFEIDDSGAKISFPTRDKAEITKEFLKSKFPDKYGKIPNFRLEESLSVKDLRILESLKDNSYKTTFKLGDILQHDELFKQYPELKDMDVMLNTKYGKKDGAMEGNTMMIGEISNSDSLKGLILHELQHNIQVKEKFALGSNPIAENQIIAKEVQKKIDAVNEKMMKNKEGMDSMSNSEFEQMKIRHKELEAQRSELEDKMDRLRKYESEGFDQYNRSAGEVEARNVQSRMNLTAKERTLKSPESTEDVPRSKQIIRMDSKGPAMSIKSPDSKLIEEARKYRNVEEFKALGFEKILEDLRGVKNDSIVEIPTKDIKIVWKQDLENAKEFAKKTYNINEAPPVDFTYDIKTGKYILEDGHHRYISALRNKSNLKGKIDGIKGNMEELANLYEKEKLVSIKQIYEQAHKTKPITK